MHHDHDRASHDRDSESSELYADRGRQARARLEDNRRGAPIIVHDCLDVMEDDPDFDKKWESRTLYLHKDYLHNQEFYEEYQAEIHATQS